jgi:excisionase family DNA binding protein
MCSPSLNSGAGSSVHQFGYFADEVQDVLRISRATFFRLASKGEIPGVVKIGKALRIDRDQLKAYMKKTVTDG